MAVKRKNTQFPDLDTLRDWRPGEEMKSPLVRPEGKRTLVVLFKGATGGSGEWGLVLEFARIKAA